MFIIICDGGFNPTNTAFFVGLLLGFFFSNEPKRISNEKRISRIQRNEILPEQIRNYEKENLGSQRKE
jgi:uncharacterized protein (UPF0297 family)